jgi:hypothetical protein
MGINEVAALLNPTFCQPWKHREAIYRRLGRLHDEGADMSVVRRLVGICEDDNIRDASVRGSADNGLRKLLPLLPRDEMIARARGYLTHHRHNRRETGRRVLVTLEASEAADFMLHRGLMDHDETLIRSAFRLGADCSDLDAMLPLVGDGTIASRLIEKHAEHINIGCYAEKFPSAVFRYIGRTRRHDLGPLVIQILEQLLSEPFSYFRGVEVGDLIGLGFWTLGQLGLREDIIRLESTDLIQRIDKLNATAEAGHRILSVADCNREIVRFSKSVTKGGIKKTNSRMVF